MARKRGKREGLEGHDVLLLNRELLRKAGQKWTDEAIQTRTRELIDTIIQIWPVPTNHRSGFSHYKPNRFKKVQLIDRINAGQLSPGMLLFPRRKKFGDKVATLLSDGQVEVDGVSYVSPSPAANKIVGAQTNGWSFFLIDQASRRSLRNVRRDYIDAMAVEAEDEEVDDDDDDDV